MDIIKINTDGTAQRVTVDDTNRLTDLQQLVGGYVEMISLSNNLDLLGNDEAKFIAGHERNHLAESILKHFGRTLRANTYLAGDMLLVGTTGSEWTSAPTSVTDVLAAVGAPLSD